MSGLRSTRTTRSARLVKLVALLSVLGVAGVGAFAAFGAATVPTPTITAKPANPTNSTSASFSFTGAASGAKYECKLDAAAFAVCTSPKVYTVAAGSHTFQVRVVDKNKTSDPASWTWTVDLTAPPVPSITAKPSNPSDLTAPSFSFTDSEAGVSFQCKLDAAVYAACASPKAYSGLALGSHTFSVQATDAAGNVGAASSWTWSIVPPAPTITAKPANPTNVTSASFSFTDALAGVTYVCALDTPTFTACASPQNYPGPLAQGSHTFQVKAVSGVHQSASTVYTWTVDTAASPTPTITAKPASLSNTTSPSFSFTDSEAGVSFLCKLDAGAYVACSSSTSYTGLAQGAHTFSVEAKDAAGNIGSPASWSWTIDSLPPPVPVLTDKPDDPNGDGIADFTWTDAEAGVTFKCSIENGPFATCTSPVHYLVNVANDGQHQFAVSAFDAAGNASTVFYSWKVREGDQHHPHRQRGWAARPGPDAADRAHHPQPEQLPRHRHRRPGHGQLRTRRLHSRRQRRAPTDGHHRLADAAGSLPRIRHSARSGPSCAPDFVQEHELQPGRLQRRKLRPQLPRNGSQVMTKRKVILALLPILVCLGAVSGWAYWTTIGSGTASASNGTLTAPSNVTVPSDSTGSVQVSWNGTIGPDSSAVTGYYVQRYGGTPSPANACGTDPLLSNTWIAAGSDPRSCDDLNLDDGTYTYKVTAVWRTWTAQSAPSGNVTVVGSAASTTTLTSSLNPSQVGDQVTYTATVSAAALGTPTGNVEFLDGGVAIVACGGATGTAVNGSGVATCDVTYNAAGSHTITAEYLGDASHSASSSNTVTQVVDKADQAITFTSTAPSAAQVAGSTYTVTATGGNSGNPVTFSIDASASAVCSISGSTVSFTAAGTCKINANQAGNSNYNAAPQVQQTFTVAKGDQTITFAALADRRLDQTPLALTASSSSGLAVSFSSATASVCTVTGNSVTLLQTGTCTINADQAGNANWNPAPQVTRSFTVLKGNQTISFTSTAPASAKVGGATYTPTATATSGLPVTFTIDATASSVCSISAGVVSFQSVGTCKVNANQPGNTNWNAAPQVQQTFTVAKGDQTITFGALANKTFDQGPITVSATASSALAVTFSSATTGVCTVSGSTVTFVTIGTCTINANQAGDANWNAATQVQQSFTISKGNQTISFTSTAPASAKVGGATYTPTATATSGLPVTMTIDATASSVCSISAGVVSFQTVGTCKINANQAGNTNWNAAPQVQQTFTVAKGDQTITFAARSRTGVFDEARSRSAPPHPRHSRSPSPRNSPTVCTVSGRTVTFVKTRQLHPQRQPGRRRQLERRHPGAAELHDHQGQPDHHVRHRSC